MDGRVKQITETALTYLLAAHPNARFETRDGKKIVIIPTYDIGTDEVGTVEKEVVADPVETPVGIAPVFNVRSGPVFNPGGDVRTSPLGHLYKIIGYTPPKKEDPKNG